MNKKKLITPLFILSSFILVGCSSDTIVARPSWIDEKILEGVGDKDNKMKNIYDAVKKLGDTNSTVLSNIMRKIAEQHIGTYEELEKWGSDEDKSVKDSKFAEFINSHEIYKSEEKGFIKDASEPTTLSDEAKLKISFNKVKNQYDQIVEDIYEKLYDDIKGGSYSEDNLFSEKKFIMHLRKELYETNTYYNKDDDTLYKTDKSTKLDTVENKFLTIKSKTYLESGEYVDLSWKNYVDATSASKKSLTDYGFLHISDDTAIYNDYINRKILPDLYSNYLTQIYVKQQRYSSLGRSYARKVNMITIPHNKDHNEKILAMLNYFAKTKITGEKDGETIEVKYDFEDLAKALRGFVGTTTSTEKPNIPYELASTYLTPIKDSNETTDITWTYTIDKTKTGTTKVYYGTKLGDIIVSLKKCCDVTSAGGYTLKSTLTSDGETAYNDLTKNRTYDLERGLAIKEREAMATDYTKDGWFLKNGGLTDLNATFRDNLFNISTSTLIDNKDKISGKTAYEGKDNVRYFGLTKGTEGAETDPSDRHAFLATATTSKDKPWETIVLNDKSSNFYIVAVDEAANIAKMSSVSNNGSYVRLKAGTTAEESTIAANKLASDIIKANSSSDTYKKNANEYYLMISNIVFYDQSVYDYFKSQFPDLFK